MYPMYKKYTLWFLFFYTLPIIGFAGNIFVVEHPNQADIKIYIVDYPNQADLHVFVSDKVLSARKEDTVWYYVKYPNQADLKVYFVDYPNQADFKVFFVEFINQARWITENQYLGKLIEIK